MYKKIRIIALKVVVNNHKCSKWFQLLSTAPNFLANASNC